MLERKPVKTTPTQKKRSLTQAQDHDRRIGRLEGIAEQLDHRLDSLECAITDVRVPLRWVIGI